MICYLEINEILELHFWIIEDFGGSHGVRDELGLKSLIADWLERHSRDVSMV